MAQIILCKISPDPVGFWLNMSGFGQMELVQKQACLATASEFIRFGCGLELACLLDCFWAVAYVASIQESGTGTVGWGAWR